MKPVKPISAGEIEAALEAHARKSRRRNGLDAQAFFAGLLWLCAIFSPILILAWVAITGSN